MVLCDRLYTCEFFLQPKALISLNSAFRSAIDYEELSAA